MLIRNVDTRLYITPMMLFLPFLDSYESNSVILVLKDKNKTITNFQNQRLPVFLKLGGYGVDGKLLEWFRSFTYRQAPTCSD